MGIRLNLKYLNYDRIRSIAVNFLKRYPHRIGPPVEIEEIAELEMDLQIVPVSGLRERHEIDGFTSSDLSQIFVDESVFNHSNDNRYRFTLAHEVGHIEMHRDIFRRFKFADLDAYRQFIKEVHEDDYGWLEQHANCFAGLVLVPSVPLRERFEDVLRSKSLQQAIREAKQHGLDREGYLEHVTKQIAERVARYFHVSSGVVIRRLRPDGLVDQIP